MKYTADKDSISKHEVPEWYHNAKLGIFIHWGLYSVPAFAVTGMDLVESMKKGLEVHFKNNPYAEWYLNTLRIPDSPTQKYHHESYGENFSYDDFVPKRSINLPDGIKRRGMKIGFYYSTAWDWSFNLNPIKDAASFLDNYINPPEYTEYVNTHIYELIDRYKPTILWADMGYPPGTNVLEIFAYFYNKIPDGVVNDRWKQIIPKEKKFTRLAHCDFTTPEYSVFKKIKKKKWETCRGIGNSFGYNKFESEGDYLTAEDLILMLIDIVSKNGNLLLNIGPKADGTIPEGQKKCLLGLGKWLDVNGDAIFGTRPWISAKGNITEGIPVRFTQKNDTLYVILMGKPQANEISIENLNLEGISKVNLLGNEDHLIWRMENGTLNIALPDKIDESPAISFKIIIDPVRNS